MAPKRKHLDSDNDLKSRNIPVPDVFPFGERTKRWYKLYDYLKDALLEPVTSVLPVPPLLELITDYATGK